ncbi:MAG TPA: YbjN domain-containing protein [Kiloniellales bacterium]|nr:YbjN domain-containing protein [Kiloniellales bacterium]
MAIAETRRSDTKSNPLDILEELVSANDWTFNRESECELLAVVDGRWCDYQLHFLLQDRLDAMFVTCQIDLKVNGPKRVAVYELLAAVNETLWLGHFDFVSEEGAPMFRHTIPLRGAPGLSAEQLEDVVDVALTECERFYPALQLVVWGGRTVAEALTVARMETVGEA